MGLFVWRRGIFTYWPQTTPRPQSCVQCDIFHISLKIPHLYLQVVAQHSRYKRIVFLILSSAGGRWARNRATDEAYEARQTAEISIKSLVEKEVDRVGN